jgi:hypothetical protein
LHGSPDHSGLDNYVTHFVPTHLFPFALLTTHTFNGFWVIKTYIRTGRKVFHGIMSAADIARPFVFFIIRVVCGCIHLAIFVPIGIITSLPPLLYWILLLLISSKNYDVDKIAPFLSPKKREEQSRDNDEELILAGHPRTRPRIFFDGSAWSIGFEMGVCQHFIQAGHTCPLQHIQIRFSSCFELT